MGKKIKKRIIYYFSIIFGLYPIKRITVAGLFLFVFIFCGLTAFAQSEEKKQDTLITLVTDVSVLRDYFTDLADFLVIPQEDNIFKTIVNAKYDLHYLKNLALNQLIIFFLEEKDYYDFMVIDLDNSRVINSRKILKNEVLYPENYFIQLILNYQKIYYYYKNFNYAQYLFSGINLQPVKYLNDSYYTVFEYKINRGNLLNFPDYFTDNDLMIREFLLNKFEQVDLNEYFLNSELPQIYTSIIKISKIYAVYFNQNKGNYRNFSLNPYYTLYFQDSGSIRKLLSFILKTKNEDYVVYKIISMILLKFS